MSLFIKATLIWLGLALVAALNGALRDNLLAPHLGPRLSLAVSGKLPLDRLISHRLPADRFLEGIELMKTRAGQVVKVVLIWE